MKATRVSPALHPLINFPCWARNVQTQLTSIIYSSDRVLSRVAIEMINLHFISATNLICVTISVQIWLSVILTAFPFYEV
ncbi:hypothetical protein GDO81_009403 [Engystomops pustulosus]|uniref:Uncharacterized protein n=1 Tax=Engystomops pustulosus TaxID=76066 RepID=A0AAV7BQI1_ENGPU|nr:hypothetical protein GDO81_009403 [Engystomops pustulosus]